MDLKLFWENKKFWHILALGHWETQRFLTLKHLVKKQDIIFDVGAWNGVYSLFISKLVCKKGKGYRFEPDPMAMQLLKTNIKFNGNINTKLENLAVSNTEGKEIFHILGEGGNSESFFNKAKEINRSKLTSRKLLIETTSLDRYCSINIIIPNGIKIDVEGAETMVFHGLENIIRTYKPWISLEFHG